MKKNQTGQAAIVIIFVLGMVSLLIGLSLLKTGVIESFLGRGKVESVQAFYLANAGVEDALYRIQRPDNFGFPGPTSYTLNLPGGTAEVKVYGTEDFRTIETAGNDGKHLRLLKVEVQNTSTMPGFVSAIQAGNGGVELEGTTEVRGKGGVPGNVYSKSFIKGKDKKDTSTGCHNSASAIYGSAWAVDKIASLDPGSGVCITASASATFLNNCFVHGTQFSPNSPQSCDGGISQYIAAVPIIDLPDLGIDHIKNYLTDRGDIYNGDCEITGSGLSGDCLAGTKNVGDIKINGNLKINPKPGVTIKFTGPIWVTGNLEIVSNSRISPLSTSLSQITVVDGRINSSSNVSYYKNGSAFLLFISTYVSGPDSNNPTFCDNPAITLASNNESVLFYSMMGCVQVGTGTPGGGFKGALLGEAIRVKNNTVIEYDPSLQTAIFGLTNSGGWQVLSFKEL
jgi:hypothetical protein